MQMQQNLRGDWLMLPIVSIGICNYMLIKSPKNTESVCCRIKNFFSFGGLCGTNGIW